MDATEQTRKGLCTICRKAVLAEEVVRDGKVWLRKQCPACGPTESLVSTDAQSWQAKRDIWHYDPQSADGCSLDCTRCGISHHPTIVFIDVTNRCNMNCPICIANIRGMGYEFHPPMRYFEKIFRELGQFNPRPMLQFFGGEPTLREDLNDLIQLARSYGLKSRVVTNGLRLADEDYCRKLCEAGVRFMFAFDGRSPEIYKRLRKSSDALEKKTRALAHLKKYSRRKITLLCCAARKINEDYIGDLIEYCHDNAGLIDTLGLIPLTENWEPDKFEADVNTTREDAEKMVQQSVSGGQVEFFPAGITHHLARARSFFRAKSTSEHLLLGGVHPDCETATLLVSDGQRFRSANTYLKLPLSRIAEEILILSKRIDPKLARLDNRKLLHRLRGQLLIVRTFASLAVRAIDLRCLFKSHPVVSLLRIVAGRLKGRRTRDLLYEHMNVPRVLRVVVLPFEEYHSLDSARVKNCKAVFAYEDAETGAVKTVSACAWNTFRNDLLRRIAEKYGRPADGVHHERQGI